MRHPPEDNIMMDKKRFLSFLAGVLIGLLAGTLVAVPLAGQMGISWRKEQVTPVVIVEPGVGGFSPVKGTKIGNFWSKEQVLPICSVKPSLMGFIPTEGGGLLYNWRKEEVKPTIEVTPSLGQFVPAQLPE
jgi:hypothetical protein